MNKTIKKFVAVGLCLMSMGTSAVMASPMQPTSVVSQQSSSVNDLSVGTTTVYYSDLVEGNGAVNFDVFLPEGVKFTTTDPYEFRDAVSHNYDVYISEGLYLNQRQFNINVNWSNQGVEYLGDWIFNIDGSVFSDKKDRTFKVNVINDLAHIGTPKITTNVDNGVTVQQLLQGFDLTMNIENARFNTSCFGNYIRVSMINSSGLGIYPVAYCNGLKPNQVKMRVQAMNGVDYWRTHFEFKIEGNASNSPIPITVRIPIIR